MMKNGIEVVPYKGTTFSKQFFGDLASRESSDIDLVIKPEYLDRAIQILKEDNYLPEMDDIYHYLGMRYFSYYKDYCLNKFIKGAREFHIELHWGITQNSLTVNPKANMLLYNADIRTIFVKSSISTLDDLSHFSAILIHHSFNDTFKYLKNIIDISQGLRHPGIGERGDTLNKSFSEFGLKKALSMCDTLSGQLMGISLLQTEASLNDSRITNHFISQVCSQQVFNFAEGSKQLLLIKNVSILQDSLIKRIKIYWMFFTCHFIPGQADFRLVFLPRPLYFLYYFMKPFRTLIKPMDAAEEKRRLIPKVS